MFHVNTPKVVQLTFYRRRLAVDLKTSLNSLLLYANEMYFFSGFWFCFCFVPKFIEGSSYLMETMVDPLHRNPKITKSWVDFMHLIVDI